MARLSRRRIAQGIVRLLNEQSNRKAELLKMAAAYLLHTKQSGSAHLLMNDIADELLRFQRILNAEVRSAFALSSATRESIVALLRRETGATNVELSEIVEPELIGGAVVRTAQLELDTSVKRQLTQLAKGTI